MALRAEQWMVLGLGAIGAYAVYRLVTTRPTPPGEMPILVDRQPPPQPMPTPPGQPPGPITLSQSIVETPGRLRVGLRHGGDFKGRIERPGSTREQLQRELKDMAWDNVQIYMTAAEAQASGAVELVDALANPTPGSRWFSGKWRGRNNIREVPTWIVLLWPTVETLTAGYGWAPAWAYAG